MIKLDENDEIIWDNLGDQNEIFYQQMQQAKELEQNDSKSQINQKELAAVDQKAEIMTAYEAVQQHLKEKEDRLKDGLKLTSDAYKQRKLTDKKWTHTFYRGQSKYFSGSLQPKELVVKLASEMVYWLGFCFAWLPERSPGYLNARLAT